MAATAWPFITHDATGVALIEGTQTKVIEVALDRLAHEWNPEEICRQHPDLSLPQVHAALGYYFENRVLCDRLIEEGLNRADDICTRRSNVALMAKLRSHAGQ